MQVGGGALLRAQIGGCDAPAIAGRDRLTSAEISYVMGRRAACRASWQACSEMVQRSVHDVRMACDPEYAKAFAAPEAVARVAEVASVKRSTLANTDAAAGRVLKALGSLARKFPSRMGADDTPRITAAAVASSMGVTASWVGQRLRRLNMLGLVTCDHPSGDQVRMWAVSARGLAEIALLDAGGQ